MPRRPPRPPPGKPGKGPPQDESRAARRPKPPRVDPVSRQAQEREGRLAAWASQDERQRSGGDPRGGPDRQGQVPNAGAHGAPAPRPTHREERHPPRGPHPSATSTRRRPPWPDQVEGRNPVLCALRAGDRLREIWLDARARPDTKLDELVRLAAERGVAVVPVPRDDLDAHGLAEVHNGVIGFGEPLSAPSLSTLLHDLEARGVEPFLLLLDEVQYEQNLGAVLRSAACAGVHGIVVPTRRGAPLSPVVQRIAMGGAEEVPLIREGLLSAAATLHRAGVRLIGAEADGSVAAWDLDWTGPLALVLGGEDHGLGPALRARCDAVVRIPLAPGTLVSSLNVSVTAGVLLFQRVRALA